ncbi:MAG TPA: hypothetical protein VE225_02215 [Rubrobacteraceae bacterium]|nr:hypothetical protein [Rubrobacteraceae bacterium]
MVRAGVGGAELEPVKTVRRTPDVSLEEIFLRAAAGLPGPEDYRGEVVAEALGYLQEGFGAHYTIGTATDDAILVGDHAYARAVETIARLDEPRFIEVASRMIRDGAGEISRGNAVSLELWTTHLAQLLGVISDESEERSEERIEVAIGEVKGASQ